MPRTTVTALFAVGFVLPPAAFTVADLINPSWSPVETTISHYVHAPRGGWLIPFGLLLMAVASGVLTWRIGGGVPAGRIRAGRVPLGIWTVSVVAGAVFPADPPGRWDQPPTTAAVVHASAALLAFTALPVAAVLLTRRWRRDPQWRRVAGALTVAAALCTAAFALFAIAFADVLNGPSLALGPWETVTGLTERLTLWCYAAWLTVAAAGSARNHETPRCIRRS